MSAGADPINHEQWQEAVDAAEFALLVDSARKFGLIDGGPQIDVGRCEELLRRGRAMGFEPHVLEDVASA